MSKYTYTVQLKEHDDSIKIEADGYFANTFTTFHTDKKEDNVVAVVATDQIVYILTKEKTTDIGCTDTKGRLNKTTFEDCAKYDIARGICTKSSYSSLQRTMARYGDIADD